MHFVAAPIVDSTMALSILSSRDAGPNISLSMSHMDHHQDFGVVVTIFFYMIPDMTMT